MNPILRLHRADGATECYDVAADEERIHEALALQRSIPNRYRGGEWTFEDHGVVLADPRGFRRCLYEAESVVNGDPASPGGRLIVQADTVRLAVAVFCRDARLRVRIDLRRTGEARMLTALEGETSWPRRR